MSESVREIALAYARNGKKVFPCYASGEKVKAPMVEGGLHSASTDEKKISHWFARVNPAPAIGLPCAPNGLVVIDFDHVEDLTKWQAVCARFSPDGSVPKTRIVKTPNGFHVYFKASEAVASSIPNAVGWSFEKRRSHQNTGIDFRTKGYVIAPGSRIYTERVVDQEGVQRTIVEEKEYRCCDDCAVAELPGWLFDVMQQEKREHVEAVVSPVNFAPDGQDRGFLTCIERIASAPEGQRNDTLNKMVFSIAGMVAEGRVDEQTALTEIERACEHCGLYDGEQGKTRQTVLRAFNEGRKHPLQRRNNAPSYVAPHDASFFDYVASPCVDEAYSDMPELKAKEKPAISFPSALDEWDRITSALSNKPEPIDTGVPALNAALDGGLRNGLGVIGAIPACGKSALVLQVADHIAASGRNVLFYALEMTAGELRERSLLRELSLSDCIPPLDTLKSNARKRRERATDARLAIQGRKPKYEKLPLDIAIEPELEERISKYKDKVARRLFVRDSNLGYDVLYEQTRPTVEGLIEDVHAFIEQHPNEEKPVVFVDYIQLLSVRDRKANQNAYERMNAVAYELKQLSNLGMPVVVVSSFNRASYHTRASLDAFKESGGIEYTASYAIALGYREMIDEDSLPNGRAYNRAVASKFKGENAEYPVRIEINCVKAREFEAGRSEAYFDGAFYRFRFVPLEDRLTDKDVYARYRDWVHEQKQNTK